MTVFCRNYIYDFYDTIHCLNACVWMLLSSVSKKFLLSFFGFSDLFNGCKMLVSQSYQSQQFEDSLLEC